MTESPANGAAPPVIELQDLHKHYGEGEVRLHVLKGIDLRVEVGEFVAITGASGSGKSTLMNILGCLDRPTQGHYRLDGDDVSTLSDDRLSSIRNDRIGFIFQSFNLIAGLSVLDNVQVPLLYGPDPLSESRDKCVALLESVGLGHRMGHKPNQLSGGERQRVAIARSLVRDPVLILADEPTGNLDSKTGRDVMQILHDLHEEGRTIVLITHDPKIAENAERQIRMVDGLIETGIHGESAGVSS